MCYRTENIYPKNTKIALKLQKLEILAVFTFWGVLGHSGVLGVNQKSPEISTKTNRTELNLRELNPMGNTHKVKYNFGAWQIL